MISLYELMGNLGRQIDKRRYAETLVPEIPEPLRPQVTEIIQLMRQMEALDERMIDLTVPDGDREEYALGRTKQEALMSKLKSLIDQLAKDARKYE